MRTFWSQSVWAGLGLLCLAFFEIACQSPANRPINFPSPPALAPSAGFELGTSSFVPGGKIAGAFTCDGENLSPALAWIGSPARTRSFVLIMEDANEGQHPSVHWIVYNIPATATGVPQAIPGVQDLAGGARQGVTDFSKTGYSGPCPKLDRIHHYTFKLYALNTSLPTKSRARAKYVEREMMGHVLAEAAIKREPATPLRVVANVKPDDAQNHNRF